MTQDADDVAITTIDAICRRHPQHHLTLATKGATSWSWCGACEGDAVREFIANLRDPRLRRRFWGALTDGQADG